MIFSRVSRYTLYSLVRRQQYLAHFHVGRQAEEEVACIEASFALLLVKGDLTDALPTLKSKRQMSVAERELKESRPQCKEPIPDGDGVTQRPTRLNGLSFAIAETGSSEVLTASRATSPRVKTALREGHRIGGDMHEWDGLHKLTVACRFHL